MTQKIASAKIEQGKNGTNLTVRIESDDIILSITEPYHGNIIRCILNAVAAHKAAVKALQDCEEPDDGPYYATLMPGPNYAIRDETITFGGQST